MPPPPPPPGPPPPMSKAAALNASKSSKPVISLEAAMAEKGVQEVCCSKYLVKAIVYVIVVFLEQIQILTHSWR